MPYSGARILTPRRLQRSARDRKSTRLNSSHSQISYAVFCLKKKKFTVQIHGTPCPHAPTVDPHLTSIDPFSSPMSTQLNLCYPIISGPANHTRASHDRPRH